MKAPVGRPKGSAGSKGEAYERPEFMPQHPADAAGRRWERELVATQRAKGVGWQNIARMAGRTIAELKRDNPGVA